MAETILVVGATGNTGSQTVRHLLKQGARVRASVRSKGKIGDLDSSAVEIVEADVANLDSLSKASSGASRVFLVPPMLPDMAGFCDKWTQAAAKAGVHHIVKLSALGTESEAIDLLRWHRAGERVIESSGVPWTFLRPNSFHQNFIAFNAASIREQNVFYLPLADSAWSTVDISDIGGVAAQVLTNDSWAGQSIDITGPEALTNSQIAKLFSKVLGREIQYVPVPDQAALDGMLAAQMPEWAAKAVLGLYQYIREGRTAEVSDAVPKITGKPAISFQQFIEANRKAFS